MYERYLKGVAVRVLRNGDTDTIMAVFDRLSDESKRLRFGGPKPRLSETELATLARVDGDHHVLVAYLDGDPAPVGVARLVLVGRREAEVAFAVADEHQRRGIGTALAHALAADAEAAGFIELHATVTGNPHAVTPLLARSAARLRSRWHAGELRVIAALD
jgi:GNAT superfamily N-acetyltransferase